MTKRWFQALLGSTLLLSSVFAQAEQFKVLLFTKTDGYHHEAIHEGVDAMRALAAKHFFALDWHEDARVFTDDNLKQYQAVVFMMTTGDILDEQQQSALESFIQAGKGFVGIHSASSTERDWDWYTAMVGRTMHIHPEIQTGEVSVLERKFPGLARMPERFLWTDEFYEFGVERNSGLNYILSVDESTYAPAARWGDTVGDGMGDFHPLAWYQHYDGGRAFYTSLGHMPQSYSDPMFLEHIYGGLYWAATGKGLRH